MNEVLLKRISKHKNTLDLRNSSVRRLGELKNLIVGEVRGTYDCNSYCFIVRGSLVTISDLLTVKESKVDFSYNTTTGMITKYAALNYHSDCERLLSYVFIMLDYLDGTSQKSEVH